LKSRICSIRGEGSFHLLDTCVHENTFTGKTFSRILCLVLAHLSVWAILSQVTDLLGSLVLRSDDFFGLFVLSTHKHFGLSSCTLQWALNFNFCSIEELICMILSSSASWHTSNLSHFISSDGSFELHFIRSF
jgi:hypothetical protein